VRPCRGVDDVVECTTSSLAVLGHWWLLPEGPAGAGGVVGGGGLQLFQSQAGNTPWSLLMAASTLTVAPVLLLFVLASRVLMRGIGNTGGGLREG